MSEREYNKYDRPLYDESGRPTFSAFERRWFDLKVPSEMWKILLVIRDMIGFEDPELADREWAFPSYETLMDLANIGNRRTLSKNLKRMKKAGILEIEKNDRRKSSNYRILDFDPIEATRKVKKIIRRERLKNKRSVVDEPRVIEMPHTRRKRKRGWQWATNHPRARGVQAMAQETACTERRDRHSR